MGGEATSELAKAPSRSPAPGNYPFAAEVTVMSIAIFATLLTGGVLAAQALLSGEGRGGGGPRVALLLAGRAALTLAFILFPSTIRDAIAMLTCQQVR